MTEIFSINWLFILMVGLGFEKTMEKLAQVQFWNLLASATAGEKAALQESHLNPDVYSSVCCTLSHSQPVLYMYFFVLNNP